VRLLLTQAPLERDFAPRLVDTLLGGLARHRALLA
jgi:hypothetical protein